MTDTVKVLSDDDLREIDAVVEARELAIYVEGVAAGVQDIRLGKAAMALKTLADEVEESDRIIKSYNDQEWKANTALREQLAQLRASWEASERQLTEQLNEAHQRKFELQSQLAQVTQERDNLRSEANNRIVKLQEEIQILRHENQP